MAFLLLDLLKCCSTPLSKQASSASEICEFSLSYHSEIESLDLWVMRNSWNCWKKCTTCLKFCWSVLRFRGQCYLPSSLWRLGISLLVRFLPKVILKEVGKLDLQKLKVRMLLLLVTPKSCETENSFCNKASYQLCEAGNFLYETKHRVPSPFW